ncbi:MAG: 50S ribosomal protein L6 [Thiotrichaceae bacterium]|nr:50S ribosomal protein L6 [Thiotrichaceae bacterium]
MSKIAKKAIEIPSGVECKLEGQAISIKGSNGAFEYVIHDLVEIKQDDTKLTFAAKADERKAWAMAGTMRQLTANMITGVSTGFEKKLQLVGVGYRAKANGNKIDLTLGFSHPVVHDMPEGITCETPSQTEITIKGADKQQVGQVAAEIRAYRPPEPYKGKGVRYLGERIIRKEAKKK